MAGISVCLLAHVLEHLYDPLASLKRIRSVLAEDGHVLLEVPCATAPESLPPGTFTPEHLTYFSERTISALLRKAGFQPCSLQIVLKSDHYLYPVVSVLGRKSASESGASSDFAEIDVSSANTCDEKLHYGIRLMAD